MRVTYNWKSERLVKKDTWTAYREWTVSGTTDQDAALAAVDDTDGAAPFGAVAQINDAFQDGSPLVCNGPEIKDRKGLSTFIIGADYAIPPTGEFSKPDPNPLHLPPIIRWEQVEISEKVDADLDGNAIKNAAGDPFDNATRNFIYYRLSITRNEPFFNLAKSALYSNTTNLAPITLSGFPVDAQHARCCVVIPASDFKTTAPYLPISYGFEVVLNDDLGKYPFQHRFLNQGLNGWWLDDSSVRHLGNFSDGKNATLSSPVLLDNSGLPVKQDNYDDVKVFDGKSDYTKSPVAPKKVIKTYQSEKNSVTGAWFFYYKKTRLQDWSGIGL